MNKNLKIAVLGAGMSGMAMGHSLIKAGFTNFTIYEKADRVGEWLLCWVDYRCSPILQALFR